MIRNIIFIIACLCVIVAIIVYLMDRSIPCKKEQAMEIYDRPHPVFGEKFTLGPFARNIMPVPMELTIKAKDGVTAAAPAALTAIETDAAGNRIGTYPCWPLAGAESGAQRVVFIPFAGNDRKAWPAGKDIS